MKKKNRLNLNNIVKTYDKKTNIINGISLYLDEGEVVGLLGANGCGKTTLFYVIVGITDYTSGSIFINDKKISKMSLELSSNLGIGYLPQDKSVFRGLSVEDNIMAVLELRKNLSKKDRIEKLEYLLAELHLEKVRKNIGRSLSGGECRRVEIARVLSIDPKFVLLDEPFAGVDPISISDIELHIKYLSRKGIGVLITDHNVRETLGICDRSYIISDGKILTCGIAEDIINNKMVIDTYLGKNFKL